MISEFAANEDCLGASTLCPHWLESDRQVPSAQCMTSFIDRRFTQIKKLSLLITRSLLQLSRKFLHLFVSFETDCIMRNLKICSPHQVQGC